jgi:TonB family protein
LQGFSEGLAFVEINRERKFIDKEGNIVIKLPSKAGEFSEGLAGVKIVLGEEVGEVEGIVILEVTTDIYGNVQSVKVLKSVPLLEQAAKDAVRQWVYESKVINGRPRGVIFTVTVPFELKDKK